MGASGVRRPIPVDLTIEAGAVRVLKVIGAGRAQDDHSRTDLLSALLAGRAADFDGSPSPCGLVVMEVLERLRGDLTADVFVEEWWAEPLETRAAESVLWRDAGARLAALGVEDVWLAREHVLRRPTYDDRGTLEGGGGQAARRRKVIGTAYRRDDFTPEVFFEYWRTVHAPISGRAPGLDGYIVSEVVAAAGRTHTEAFVEQWWPDQATLDAAATSPEVEVAWLDVANYAKTTGTFWLVREHVARRPEYLSPGLLER